MSEQPNPLSRRQMLRDLAATTVGFAGLWLLSCSGGSSRRATPASLRFGPLVPDPLDQIDLPAGFRYTILSVIGGPMQDGLKVPGAADGMAAFPGPGGQVILVRNHELKLDQTIGGAFGARNELLDRIDPQKIYDSGGSQGTVGLGGTTTVVYDPARDVVTSEFLSLAGTEINCAGGRTPWGTWLSCEETVAIKDEFHSQNHGYVFEVPATTTPGLVDPIPIRPLGRFVHEAVAVDPRTGILYLTEDQSDGLLYRFRPDVPGDLKKGGVLEALVLKNEPGAVTATGFVPGALHEVVWLPMTDVESPDDDLRERGYKAGAAQFARGEGIFAGNDGIYFTCTIGGPKGIGQIWKYVPSPTEGTAEETRQPGHLALFVESKDARVMHNADNIAVAPWGDLVFCEDAVADRPNGGNRLMGISKTGETYPIALNRANLSEFAGVTFSPDGSIMFVNVQFPGATLAIRGPWSVTPR